MADPAGVVVNGNRSRIEEALLSGGEPMTLGYRANTPVVHLFSPYSIPYFQVLWDTESMLAHPVISMALQQYRGAIANAEFEVTANSKQTAEFALEQVEHFWGPSNGLATAQLGYEYGWQGAEVMYRTEKHKLHFDDLVSFHARDCHPLTRQKRYVGLRIRSGFNTPTSSSTLTGQAPSPKELEGPHDLWGPRRTPACDEEKRDIPAKGFWYAHNPKHNRFWGRTQLYGAWWSWRRLAGPDGAENTTDMGVYRFAFQGPVVRYPGRDMPRPGASGNYESARDRAREFAEQSKAGVSVALPSDRDPVSNQYLWDYEYPDRTINVDSLVNYIGYLKKEIANGIGVPPELMEAADVGSGYSGRAIPMESFLMAQQRLAQGILKAFVDQVLDPLLLWNFGKSAWAKVRVKPLLATKSKNAQGGGPAAPPPQPAAPPGMPQGMPGGMPQAPPGPPPGAAPPGPSPGMDDPLAALLGQGSLSTVTLEGGGWSPPIRNTPSPTASGATPRVRKLAREVERVRTEPWRLCDRWLDTFARHTADLSGREFRSLQALIGVNLESPGARSEAGRQVEAALENER